MTHSQTSHGSHGPDKPLVSAQGYDATEGHVLDLARIFFVSFARPETQLWMKAFARAERIFGAPVGATLAQSVLRMLNAMRAARPHTFNYTDPHCPECSARMTAEEKYLMDTLRDLRRGNMATARLSALLLCEGNDPENVLTAARMLEDTIRHYLMKEVA